jgi:outer membrane lipoprotein-sorting protein
MAKLKIKKTYIQMIVLIFSCFCPAISVSAEMSARELMEKQKQIHSVTSEYHEETMLLVNRSGDKEIRCIRFYQKKMEDDLEQTLITFDTPENIRGLAMLTWENANRHDDQWLYLPSLKKLQRIAEGNRKSYFAGTDFTYEDLEPENLDRFTYTLNKTEIVNNNLCYVIEAVPANKKAKKESGYGKRIIWVKKDILFTVQVQFFNHRGRHIKTMNAYDLVQLEGNIWRANKMIMDNHKNKHKTISGVKKRNIETPIDDILFQHRFILSHQHIK